MERHRKRPTKLQLNIVRRDAFCGVYQSIVSIVGVDANFRGGKRGKNSWIRNNKQARDIKRLLSSSKSAFDPW